MDGILVINKPAGMTSHDVIARLRKRYGQKKFGHTGTLDPMASGVLVVLAGKAAKALQFIEDTDKEYTAKIVLGKSYHSDDVTGRLQAIAPVRKDFDFASVLSTFLGPQHQRVPEISAKKVGGKKLMEYARKDQPVPEVYSDIEIYSIEPLDEKELLFHVHCSKGTYIRSICRDFGEKTGNLAAMASLIRTSACGFGLDAAEDLDAPEHTLYPLESVLKMKQIHYSPIEDIYHGKHVRIDTKADRVLIMDQDQAVAVYQRDHKNVFACQRGLF